MTRYIIKIAIASLTFAIGVGAATLWMLNRRSPEGAAGIPSSVITAPSIPVSVTRDVPLQLSEYLRAIELINNDEEHPLAETPTRFDDMSGETINVDLALGENIENQIIALHVNPRVIDAEFRVEQRFETSMAIGDEGPHLDLTDWRHYRSQWRQLNRVGENRFLTFTISEADSARFPRVTQAEIYRAIVRSDDPDSRWRQLARQCRTPNSAPCYVSVSKIEFAIKVREGNEWREIKRLAFNVPMGC